ncbi:MAG: PAS domain S-box protein [Flavobacterium sp.]
MLNKLVLNEFAKWVWIIVLTIMVTTIGFFRFKIKEENRKDQMHFHLLSTKDRIEETLKNSYNVCLNLAFAIGDDGKVINFEEFAEELLANNKHIDGVQLVPNGIIKYVFPLDKHKSAIGYNILKNTTSPLVSLEANKTKFDKKIYFSGPFELKQGGFGIVGRIPVYKKGEFWGFSAVIIQLNTFFDHVGISGWQVKDFGVQFSKWDPIKNKEIFYVKNQPLPFDNYFTSTEISNEGWKIYIIDYQKNAIFKSIWFDWVILLLIYLGLLFAIQILHQRSKALIEKLELQGEQLLENSKVFHAIFNELSIGIMKVNVEKFQIENCNEFLCNMLGYDAQELTQLSPKDISFTEDKNASDELVLQLKQRKINYFSLQKRYVHKQGYPIWCNITVSGITNPKDELVYYLGIVENIQDKKEIEEINLLHQLRMESLFKDSPIPIWEEDFSAIKSYLNTFEFFDLSTLGLRDYLFQNFYIVEKCIQLLKVVEVNQACLDLHQAQSKEDLLNNFDKIFPQIAYETFTYQIISIIQNKTSFKTDSQVSTIHGELRNIHFQWNVIKGFEDNYQRVIIITEDITEKVKQEQEIRNSQAKITSLIATVEGVVWEGNPKSYTPTFISDKVESFFGYPKELWSNQSNFRESIMVEEKEKALKDYMFNVERLEKFDLEYAIKNQNGEKIWIRDCVNVISLPNGDKSVRGIMMDITTLKEVQNQLTNSLEVLTEQNKRLLNFSHIVSHNLRSHASNILSLTSLIESTDLEEEKMEYVQLICQVAKQLDATMLNLTQLTEKQINNESSKKTLNLNEYVDKAIISLQKEMREAHFYLHKDFDLKITIFINPAFLESILYNIISNAIKFRNQKTNSYLKIKGYESENFTVIEFSDNGLGMNIKGKEHKVFQLYKMFHKNISTKGLGLFMTKNQVEAMGGTIEVESKEMEGTTFIVKIPKV